MIQNDGLDWDTVQDALVRHFKSAARLATIRDISRFPNFFEPWFTAECLSALMRSFPDITLKTNENFLTFSKPDIVFSHYDFVCVLEIKHLTPLSRECRGRWNGAKGSTVARDICALHKNPDLSTVRCVVVFYGPAYRVMHQAGGTCRTKRAECLACSVADLRETVARDCQCSLREPEYLELLRDERGSFYMLVFSGGIGRFGEWTVSGRQ